MLALLCLPVVAAAAPGFPQPHGKVNDFAGVLAPADREALATQLDELERDTSAETAVVIVRSLEGRGLEEYASGLFAEWGIGKKGKDNGVLVLVAVADNRDISQTGLVQVTGIDRSTVAEIVKRLLKERYADDPGAGWSLADPKVYLIQNENPGYYDRMYAWVRA